MDTEFWLQKWEHSEIGFHQAEYNSKLLEHFSKLNLDRGAHVLVPLCGKSRDMLWLLGQGYKVTGIELSEKAILDFFRENNIHYQRDGKIFKANELTLICDDIFNVKLFDNVDAIYDRAATIALPENIRVRYLEKLKTYMPRPLILMILLNYDQAKVDGPPFSVSKDFIVKYWGDYQVELIEEEELIDRPPKFSALESIKENVYIIK